MRLILIVSLSILLSVCWCKSDKENDANELQSPVNLDERLKKALLKALNELEQEEKSKEESYQDVDGSKEESLEYSDQAIEKVPASAVNFLAHSTASTPSETSEEVTQRSIVIIQKSNGLQHKPITSTILTNARFPEPLNETDQILASSNSFSPSKSESNKLGNNPNSVSTDYEKNFGKTKKVEFTTPLPPSTTTEESQAKVEDVQFFSAPLVTAFTVHQDERGFPQSVVPLFKSVQNTAVPQPSAEDIYRQQLLQKQKLLEQQLQQLQHQQTQHQELLLRQQLILLQQQNQKLLEQQVRAQNNEQLQPISKTSQQQAFGNQLRTNQNLGTQLNSNLEINKVKSAPSINQFKSSGNENKLIGSSSNLSKNLIPQNKQKGTVVAFQPSISFSPGTQQLQQTNYSPLNFLQPPTKNPIDFHSNVFHQQPSFQQIPSISQPPRIVTSVQPALQNQFVPSHRFQQQPFQNQQPQQTRNRFNRHEVGTGNFINNFKTNNFNQPTHHSPIVTHEPIYHQQQSFAEPQLRQPTRFFRSNYENYYNVNQFRQQPVVNQQLNNLLYHSGISDARQYEDLNIISKVLSLNHLGGDNYFSASRYAEQRVPAPPNFSKV